MKVNAKYRKQYSQEKKRKDAELGFKTFQYVLGLTAYSLECMGATKLQIQSVINSILNQYDCLTAGTLTMDDIHEYLEEYGIKVNGDTLSAVRTEHDEHIDMLKLEDMYE